MKIPGRFGVNIYGKSRFILPLTFFSLYLHP